nr:DNA helicase [Tanacetum cinerariifolium]
MLHSQLPLQIGEPSNSTHNQDRVQVTSNVNVGIPNAQTSLGVQQPMALVTFSTSESALHSGSRLPAVQPSTHGVDEPANRPVSSGPPSSYRSVGKCEHICEHCGALFWYEERIKHSAHYARPKYNRCCKGGRVALRTYQIYPDYIKLLLQDRHFLENIRAYNQMFSMKSLGACVDESINNGHGPYVFKISGQLYHWIGSLCPVEGERPRFLQLYIYDTDNDVDNLMSHFGGDNSGLRRDIVEGLIDLLDTHNSLVHLFRTAREKLTDSHVPNFKVRLYNVVGAREYELPTGDMLGAIVYEPGPDTQMDYDIVLEERSGYPQRVNKLHASYMSFQFPLLFLYGEDGYSKDLKLVGGTANSNADRRLTMKAYYAYFIHDRVNYFNYLSRTGRLFQQYDVTAFCAIEQNWIDSIREHQNDIRNEYLSRIYDAISRGDNDGYSCGAKLILPQSFTGEPRYMYSHYLDALAICRVHGNASFFITFTCNVKWPEITEYMADFPLLTTTDRADIVDRVFEMKIHQFIKYLRDAQPFGKTVAVLYTIKFQKRGLPHCHALLWIHETARCMQNSTECKKHFPRDYCNRTYTDKDSFVHYRRRDTEYCGWMMLIKYLFKYISKGTDRIVARISRTRTVTQDSTSRPQIVVDEIENYLDAIYISPHEACWRMLEFEIHHREPAVQILSVHLQNMQRVVFRDRDKLDSVVVNAHSKKNHSNRKATLQRVSDPVRLWKRVWKSMSEDIPYTFSISLNISNLHIDDLKLKDYVLYELEDCLNHCSRSLVDFGLRTPPEHLMSVLRNRLLMEEKTYNRPELAREKEILLAKLNEKQRRIFHLIVNTCTNNQQELIFVYRHGGIGKTFLWKTIIYALRAEGRIILAVASSGVASLLLPACGTAHSRFKLPLDLTDTSVCSIKKNTQLATLIKETSLIVWDESPMNDRHCFKTLDRTLRDILDMPNSLFGGKTMMLGGDFRQTLPVKKQASRNELIDKEKVAIFANWLLDIGNGNIGVPDEVDLENTSWVDIPDMYRIPDDEHGMVNLIRFIYDDQMLQNPTPQALQEKVIVCPKNEVVDTINTKVMSMVPGRTQVYISYDEALPHSHDGGEVEMLYPKEYLNPLSFAGLPPHRLELKIDTPIILLRNLNITGGLFNGTRLIVKHLLPKVIEAQIVTGTRISQKPSEQGKMVVAEEPEITNVADLKSTYSKKTIEVIVYRKWISNKVLIISRFSCDKTSPWERTLENNTSLIFGKYIELHNIPNDDFPEHYFDFASYNELVRRANVKSAVLTDYIGRIHAISGISTFRDATSQRKRRRTIDIENL